MGILNSANANSASSAISNSSSMSNSWSNTAGINATNQAIASAQSANNSAMSAWRDAAEFNAAEAAKQREWQERMAATVYQRTVADMKAAGINPILAVSNGFGSGSVGSGANASMTAPNTFMANTFPESNSASTASSQGYSESQGWSHSESGLATFLESMRGLTEGLIAGLNSSKAIEVNLGGLKELFKSESKTETEKSYKPDNKSSIDNGVEKVIDAILHPESVNKRNTESISMGVKQLPTLDYYINQNKYNYKKPGTFTPYSKK